jgi:ligand-binding SRPBCC domain-containing protein
MLPPFRLGLGGRLGSGRQPVSWIHIEDLVDLIVRALVDDEFHGALNATAPNPVTNAELTRAIARTVGRTEFFPVPKAALKLALGEAADVLLGGQRVTPARATSLGFRFEFERIEEALADLLRAGNVTFRDVEDEEARHELVQERVLDAPIDEVFAFFSRAENLGAMTPPDLSFAILGEPPAEIREGTVLEYRIGLGPVPMRWTSVIARWNPGATFVDTQRRGPYAHWWHEHRFEARGERTLMRDTVRYRLPLGLLGRLVHRLFVRSKLEDIFTYRDQYAGQRFRAPRSARVEADAA